MTHSSSLEDASHTVVSGAIQVGLSGNLGECKNSTVVHIVVQHALHRKYLQEKCVGAERWDIIATSAKQTNDNTLEVMTNK